MNRETPDLRVDIGGLPLKNPVITASGTFGYGREYKDLVDLSRLGALVVKGLSLAPSRGNPPPRIVETACGMLNAIGLENVGIEAFVQKKLPWLRTLETPVVANIYGTRIEAYAELAARIEATEGIAAIEVNISCPNVKAGGIAFGVDPEAAAEVVRAVRRKTTRPVWVKLSPNVTDVAEIARSVEGAGADAISLINTLTGMAVDLDNPSTEAGQYHWRALRAGHQTGGPSHGLAGGPRRIGAGDRHRAAFAAPVTPWSFSWPERRRCRWGPPILSTPPPPWGSSRASQIIFARPAWPGWPI